MVLNKQAEEIVEQTGDLPAMPMVAQKVVSLVDKEDTSPADLQRVISADPALASKILKISNSALFSRVRTVSTLSHAILILGFSAIRSLVLTASMRSLFYSKTGDYGLKERMLWEHALGCAFASRLIAERLGYQAGVEAAFVAGLLHDIGKIVLNTNLADTYLEIFQETYNEHRTFEDVEMERLGFTHADVGALVVTKWNFSDELADMIANHHTLPASTINPYGTAIVHFANLMCHHLGIGVRKSPSIILGQAESVPILMLKPEDIDFLCHRLVTVFEEERGLFES